MTEDDYETLKRKFTARLKPLCENVEWGGHREFTSAFFLSGIAAQLVSLSLKDPTLPKKLLKGNKVLETPLALRSPPGLGCSRCDTKLLFAFDGQQIRVTSDPCPYSNGIHSVFELNVPSGKLVVANDLRTWFPCDDSRDINSTFGCHLTTLDYAGVGMAHGYVGNSSPGVYSAGSDSFVIGNYDEGIWDPESQDYVPNPEPSPWGEELTQICTDLWWYSIVDLAELVRRREYYTPKLSLEDLLKRVEVLEVKPGVYEFRHDPEARSYENEGSTAPTVYATFKWVRDPDPVRDYLAEDKAKNVTATEFLIQYCLDWPTLFMSKPVSVLDSFDSHEGKSDEDVLAEVLAAVAELENPKPERPSLEVWNSLTRQEKTHSLARAADHAMCVLGSGVDWHENGFPRKSITEDAKRLAVEYGEIESFPTDIDWYPISEGYGGLCLGAGIEGKYGDAPIKLNPSFVQLGRLICESALAKGEKHKQWDLFGRCYSGLRRRYPEAGIPELETLLKRFQ